MDTAETKTCTACGRRAPVLTGEEIALLEDAGAMVDGHAAGAGHGQRGPRGLQARAAAPAGRSGGARARDLPRAAAGGACGWAGWAGLRRAGDRPDDHARARAAAEPRGAARARAAGRGHDPGDHAGGVRQQRDPCSSCSCSARARLRTTCTRSPAQC
jgi:hypothetical protein